MVVSMTGGFMYSFAKLKVRDCCGISRRIAVLLHSRCTYGGSAQQWCGCALVVRFIFIVSTELATINSGQYWSVFFCRCVLQDTVR